MNLTYTLTLDNGKQVTMVVVEGHNIIDEITKFETIFSTITSDPLDQQAWGIPIPTKVVSYTQT